MALTERAGRPCRILESDFPFLSAAANLIRQGRIARSANAADDAGGLAGLNLSTLPGFVDGHTLCWVKRSKDWSS